MESSLTAGVRPSNPVRQQANAMRRLALLALALALGVFAFRLTDSPVPRDALILYILAGVVFALAAEAPRPWPALPAYRPWPLPALGIAAVAILLGVAGGYFLWQNLYDRVGLILWLVSWPLFIAATFWEQRAAGEADTPRPGLGTRLAAHRWELLLLVVVLAASAFMRYYRLDAIPNGCQSDECNNALDAQEWLSGVPYRPYAETNEGQATLFTYIIALFFRLFGETVHVMRMVPALMGTLTVLMLYLFVRDLFGPRPALVAAGFLAAGRWHVTFSRIVYELIMVPLVELLLAYFLLRALRGGRRRDWALAGLAMSLGLNTYTAFRVVPFAVIAFLLFWLVTNRRRWARDIEGIAVMGFGALLSVIPLGIYIVQNWRTFTSRIDHISIARDIERAGGSLAPFWATLRKTLLIFHQQGDWAALNNLPNAPQLDAIVGILFVLGLIYALRYIYRPLPFLAVSAFIIVGSVAVLSTAAEAPTARRTIGTLPIIYVLAAYVVYQIGRAWDEAWRGQERQIANMGMAAAVALLFASNYNIYFNVQAKDPSVYIAFSGYDAAVGEFLRDLSPGVRVYLTPTFDGHSAVRFISRHRNVTALNVGEQIPIREDPGGDVLYLVEEVDRPVLDLLVQVYPQGVLEEHRDPYGRVLFLTYTVPQTAIAAARGLPAQYWVGDAAEGDPALRRSDASLDFGWPADVPVSAPFVARWEGSLLVPAFGEYTLRLTAEGSGTATLTLDDEAILEADGNSVEETRVMATGFHVLAVEYRSGSAPGAFQLGWSGPAGEGAIPISNLFAPLPAARNGLVGYYFPNGDWTGAAVLIQRDPFIAPNNPLGEPYSILWRGKIAAPRSGIYTFGTRSDDGSFVHIDGELVVNNGGSHGAEYRQGSVELTEGFHDIEVRYNQLGGSREMQLWWQPPGGGNEKIPSTYLFPIESADMPTQIALPPPPAPPTPVPQETPQSGTQQPSQVAPPVAGNVTAPPVAVQQLWQTGSCGAGDGQFQQPRGLAVDAAGNVYVADSGNHRIVKLSPTGEFVQAWGQQGTGDGQFDEPFEVDILPNGNVLTLESVGQRFQEFTPDGEFVRAYGGGLTMYRPRGFDVDGQGAIYVADTGGVRLLVVSADNGERLGQVGGPDQTIGAGQPSDAVAASDGTVYLIEATNGFLWKIDPTSGNVFANSQASLPASTIDGPHLAWGPDDLLYVTDPEGFRVLVYDGNLTPVGQFGTQGDAPVQFRKPVGLAVGPDGKVYVADSPACRVQAFSPIER